MMWRAPFKSTLIADQNAFRRFDSRSCDRVRLVRLLFVCVRCLAPVCPTQTLPPSSQESCYAVLSHVPSVRLAAPLGDERKMLLIDLCNRLTLRALVDRSNSRARDLRRDDRSPRTASRQTPKQFKEGSASPPFGDPAPGGRTLDGACPTSASSRTKHISAGWRRWSGAARRQHHPAAALSTTRKVG